MASEPGPTWICDRCGEPIEGDDGVIYISAGRAQDAVRAFDDWYKQYETEQGAHSYTFDDLAGSPPGEAWRVRHDRCVGDDHPGSYDIDAGRIQTWPEVVYWTSHLMGKGWLSGTDWRLHLKTLVERSRGQLSE